jgi:hypothetical protein
LETQKLIVTGHGIEILAAQKKGNLSRMGILSVGRFASVKRYELLADGISKMQVGNSIGVTIVGPENSSDLYKSKLSEYFTVRGVKHKFLRAMSHVAIRQFMQEFDYFYSGTPNSVDKAAIEAAYAGCLIVTTSSETMNLTGMDKAWDFLGLNIPSSISEQLELLEKVPHAKKEEARKLVTRYSMENNNLKETIGKITFVLTQ